MSGPQFPPRNQGDHHDTVSMYCPETDARAAYLRVTEKLYAINEWKGLSDTMKTEFLLCDAVGQAVSRKPVVGDCIRIDLPGPGSPSGGGYDWVAIIAMEEETDGDQPYASLTIAPCPNPQEPGKEVAHFYARGATNTFVVRRISTCIQAEVHGRNERANTSEPPLLDRMRNEAIALAGKMGLSKIQWQDWTDGMVSVV